MTDPNVTQSGGGTPVGGDANEPSENLLRHYASILRRRWRWVALGLVVGLVAGVASTFMVKENTGPTVHYYKATNTLAQSSDSVNGPGSSDYTMSQAALLAQSAELLDTVSKKTGLSSQQVSAQLSATIRTDVNAIDVTAIATDPDVAVDLANASAEKLTTLAETEAGDSAAEQRSTLEDKQKELAKQRKDIETALAGNPPNAPALNAQLQNVLSEQSRVKEQIQNLPKPDSSFSLTELQSATPIEINASGYNYRRARNLNARSQLPQDGDTSNPEFDELDLSVDQPLAKRTRIALGGAAGLVLGLISAFLIEAWDDRIRRRERVEDLTGLGVLAEIPHFSRDEVRNHHIAVEDDPTTAAAERYRAARTAISFALDGDATESDDGIPSIAPVLMITSPGPGEGKTTSTANLAAAFADSGQRVLVVDGDFRRPAIRRFLAPVPNLVDPDVAWETRLAGVEFVPGPHDAPTPDAAVASLRATIEARRGDYDVVLLDTPPILTTNDAVDLLADADAVVLVLRADKTRAKPAKLVAEMLRRFQADALGVILNSCDRAEMNEYYGYGYGYNYGYLGKNGTKRAKTQKSGKNPRVSTKQETPETATATELGEAEGAHTNGVATSQEVSTHNP